MKNHLELNLQLFADENAAAESAPAAESTQTEATQTGVTAANPARRGRKENPLANVRYGRQPEMEQDAAAHSTQTRGEKLTFKQLIEGEYKNDAHEYVQGILQERFKKNAAMQKNMDDLMPVLLSLGQRYGLDMAEVNENSIKALKEKLDADDDHLEKEAMARGMTKEGYKLLLDVQNREQILQQKEKRTLENERFEQHIQKLSQQAEKIGIDLRREMQNPDFVRLTSPGVGVPVEQAYRLVHQDEILQGGMQFAAKQSAENVAKSVASGQKRIAENGMTRKGANVIYRSDPKQMSKADRDEINRRAALGEKITF